MYQTKSSSQTRCAASEIIYHLITSKPSLTALATKSYRSTRLIPRGLSVLEIDGSEKSGSGTILRISVALASILNEELHIYNIRKKRAPFSDDLVFARARARRKAIMDRTSISLRSLPVLARECISRKVVKTPARRHSNDVRARSFSRAPYFLIAETNLTQLCSIPRRKSARYSSE